MVWCGRLPYILKDWEDATSEKVITLSSKPRAAISLELQIGPCQFDALSRAKVALSLSFTQAILNLFGQLLSMISINYVGFQDKTNSKW